MNPDSRILHALRTAPGPLPIPDLAAAAEVEPEALKMRIDALRAAGFAINLLPHLGYRLTAAPDRLIPDDLIAMLRAAGQRDRAPESILVFAETGSTNDVAARLARSGAAEGLTVFAERQTAGRGRMGRRWESMAHLGLWFSVVIRPGLAASDWSRLTTWAAVAVANGIEDALASLCPARPPVRAEIKWPNDIHLNGRKAVGILIESSFGATGRDGYAVVGIGVNVNHTDADFPEELAGLAISMREAVGPNMPPLNRSAVAVALLRRLDPHLLTADFPAIVAEAEARSCLMGKRVELQGGAGPLEGIAEGLEPDGRLRIRCLDGRTVLVCGGEVGIKR